jgi:enoyl-CoA hydratase
MTLWCAALRVSILKEVFTMVSKTYENIIYDKKPPVAYVTLNRPEKLNALSQDLQLEVRDALEDAGWEDNDIRVIVLKGAGRGFSSGFDIAAPGGHTDAVQIRARFLKGQGFSATTWWDVFWNNPKPLIAQIHGFCIAGGCATVSFCDLRFCSEDAMFGAPEIRTGGAYIPAVWPWIIGMTKARELLYTGNLIDAQEAYRLGLVNKVVPVDRLEEEVEKMAQTIAKLPFATVEYNKKLINMAYEMMNIRSVVERSCELEAINLTSPGSLPEIAEFQRLRQEQGLKAALDWNAARFAEEDAWWKERRKRT